jgi:hypothetical protein
MRGFGSAALKLRNKSGKSLRDGRAIQQECAISPGIHGAVRLACLAGAGRSAVGKWIHSTTFTIGCVLSVR